MEEAPVTLEIADGIALLRLNRPAKRNAVSNAVIEALGAFFQAPPPAVKAAVLSAAGGHFCAGLDLAEHLSREAFEVLRDSRQWHRVLQQVQFGGLPVVSALKGAVIGGGLEIATATHVRVAEPSAFYELPEGKRGIFVGGGGSVRIARILGADRMTEMMLTGRRLDAAEGQRLGLSHYLVGEGEAEARALALAAQIAGNAPLSNYLAIQALARIDDMAAAEGLFTESLAVALAQTAPEARQRLEAFLNRKGSKT